MQFESRFREAMACEKRLESASGKLEKFMMLVVERLVGGLGSVSDSGRGRSGDGLLVAGSMDDENAECFIHGFICSITCQMES